MNAPTSPLSPEDLLRLLTVSEAGSFSEAARRLGLSRQAVQRAISAMESSAGAALVDRTTRALRLTPLAHSLLPHAREIRSAVRSSLALVAASQAEPTGALRVTAPPVFADAVLSRAIPRFLRDCPRVDLTVRVTAERSDPLRGDHDLTIRIGAEPPSTAYATRLGRATTVLVAAATYLDQYPPLRQPEQLAQHRLLSYGLQRGPWSLDGPSGCVTIPVELHLSSDCASLVLSAAEAGLGIARPPRIAVVESLRKGGVIEVLGDWSPPDADVWAVYGHKLAVDPSLASMLTALRETPW
jgi:DNA-binding transcriptional LysR family regulator